MHWTRDGCSASFCCWKRLVASSPSGLTISMRCLGHIVSPPIRIFLHWSLLSFAWMEPPAWMQYLCSLHQPSGRATVLDGKISHAGDPLWWADEDTKLLRGTRLGAAAEHHAGQTEQLGRWRQQLCSLQAGLGGSDTMETGCGGWAMSHEALRWAKSTVWSRAFNIPYLGLPSFSSSRRIPSSCSRSGCSPPCRFPQRPLSA